MAEIKTKQIGKYSYTASPLTGKKATKVFVRLCHVFGPIVEALDVAAAVNQDEDQMLASLSVGAGKVLMHLKEEDFEYLVDMFGKSCTVQLVEGKNPIVDQLGESFWGVTVDFTDCLPWLAFCIQTSYGNFLEEKAAQLLAAIGLRKKDKASSSQQTLTGTDGA